MNDRQDYSDIGERISTALKDALDSKDFAQLHRVVTDSVNGAVEEVRRQVDNFSQTVSTQGNKTGSGQQRQEQAASKAGTGTTGAGADSAQSYSERYRYTYRQHGNSRTMYSSQKTKPSENAVQRKNPSAQTALKAKENTGVQINTSGKVGGILWTVFGGIGTGVFGMLLLAYLLIWLIKPTVMITTQIAGAGLLCALSGSFIGKGCKILGRLNRAKRYAQLGSRQKFLELEDIARNTGRSIRKVRADVRKMLKLGIFPQGHMDSQESCLILDDETWQQYKLTQKQYESRKLLEETGIGKNSRKENADQAADAAEAMHADATADAAAAENGNETQIVRDGQAYMGRLRQLNIDIPGEVISNKLYELDYLLTRIFNVVRQQPQKAPQLRKFMEYYLPTTVKLVESYADFDKAGVQGDNIQKAKTEIEETMDTINQAFKKLLDDLYLDAVMETTADAKVLKTLLAQDGYAASDFEMKG